MSNNIARIALLLWVVTLIVFAWFFIRGSTTEGSDGRTAVVLYPSERDLVLSEMRGLLIATQGILEGANNADMQQIRKAAAKAGMASAADVNPSLMAKLPFEFKQLGMSVHRDMDNIASAAADGKPTAEILRMVSSTMTKCNACHSAWQLAEAANR